MSDVDEKLRRGFILIERSRTDSDLLGVALLAIHGALEDYFREVLSTCSSLSAQERQSLIRRDTGWLKLVEMMQQHTGLNVEHRRIVLDANEIRQSFAHGRPFRWRVSDVLRYGRFVEAMCGRQGLLEEILIERRATRAATEPIPIVEERSPPRRGIAIGNLIAILLFIAVIIGGWQVYTRLDIPRLLSVLDAVPTRTATSAAPLTSPPSTTRQAQIVGLGGGPGWLHETPDFSSGTLPIRLGEGMQVTVLGQEQTDSDGLLWRYVSVNGYEGWCPAKNLAFVS